MPEKKRKRIKEPYRLLLLRDDTLAEVGSYRLSLLNIYIALSALLIVTSTIVFILIFFTPMRRLVPGYANVYESREYRDLSKKVREMESEIQDQRLYMARFSSMLSGIPVTDSALVMEDSGTGDQGANTTGLTPVTPAPVSPSSNPIVPAGGNERFGTRYLAVVPPVRGIISSTYDPNDSHLGTDILAPENTPVLAILDGTIVFSDWTLETGNTIAIQHEGNMVSVYKHNSRNLKKLGARVNAGEAVAIIGNTGEATSGPHLHFELWIDGKSVDPEQFVNF